MSDIHVPEWLVRCHWCATNYDRRGYALLAPHRYHWLCWFDSLIAKWWAVLGADDDGTPGSSRIHEKRVQNEAALSRAWACYESSPPLYATEQTCDGPSIPWHSDCGWVAVIGPVADVGEDR